MRRLPLAITILLTMNIVVFLICFVPAWREAVNGAGALWYPDNAQFGPWQIVTYMFLHADVSHIFFNMFALGSFGVYLEREWGATRFVVFYLLCGQGAALIQTGLNWFEYQELYQQLIAGGMKPAEVQALMATGYGILPESDALKATLRELYYLHIGRMVGASGAIYGLLVAFGFLYPNAKLALMFVPVPVAAKYFIPVMLGLDFFSGVTGFSLFGAGVAHFAHLGGALIGFLLMLLWRKRSQSESGLRAEG